MLLRPPPAFVGSPKQGASALAARLCDGVGPRAARPRAANPSTEPLRGEGTGLRPAPSLATASGGPPAPPSFGKRQMPQHLCRLQAEWRHGVGRHARQMRGDILRTCNNLRVRSRSQRVQTGMYRCLYRFAATFPFSFKENSNTLACVEVISEYMRVGGSFPMGLTCQSVSTIVAGFSWVKAHTCLGQSPQPLVSQPTPKSLD